MNASLTPGQTKVEQVKLLIDGQWVESKTSEWRDVVNPATQQVLARVPFATAEEVDAAIAAGQRAFKTWRDTPIGARMRIMLKLQALIREHSKRIAVVLSAEQGKTIADAEGDIFRGLEVVEHACSIGTLQMGEFAENVAGGVDTYTLRQPIGVCAGITPFNFPAMIPLWMFPMAIVCGNTFVLKRPNRTRCRPCCWWSWRSKPVCRPACSTSSMVASRWSMRCAPIPISRRSLSLAPPRLAPTSITWRGSTASACNR